MKMTAVRRFWVAVLQPFLAVKTRNKKYGTKWWFEYFRWFFERLKYADLLDERGRKTK